MAAVKIDLTIEEGASFRKTFLWKDTSRVAIDLTGYTARMQIRKTVNSSTIIQELTTENGGITITALEGKIELYISETDTSAYTYDKGSYDLELILGGEVVKFSRGYVYIIEETTR